MNTLQKRQNTKTLWLYTVALGRNLAPCPHQYCVKTLEEVAVIKGISRSLVHYYEKNAFRKLARAVKGDPVAQKLFSELFCRKD